MRASAKPSRPRAAPRAADRRKARFAERDRRIRDVTQRLLLERGLHGFSMDDVADAIAYSKGTIYQHYRSKEDALLGSCACGGADLAGRLERAAATRGRSRERMLAVASAYSEFIGENLAQFRTIPLMHSPAVLEKASPEVLKALHVVQTRCVGALLGVVRDAIAEGDLRPPRGTSPESITFALWAAMFGAYMLVELKRPHGVLGITDAAVAVRESWSVTMDGLGWKPVSRDRSPTSTAPSRAGRSRGADDA